MEQTDVVDIVAYAVLRNLSGVWCKLLHWIHFHSAGATELLASLLMLIFVVVRAGLVGGWNEFRYPTPTGIVNTRLVSSSRNSCCLGCDVSPDSYCVLARRLLLVVDGCPVVVLEVEHDKK